MDTDKVNTYLHEMIDYRQNWIDESRNFFPNQDKPLDKKLEIEIDLLELLQREMIAKGTYDVRFENFNKTFNSNGRCSYDD